MPASSAIRAIPGPAYLRRRSTAAVSSSEPAIPAGMRAGLSETPSAQVLMSGWDANDIAARPPNTCIRAQSAGVLGSGEGGQIVVLLVVVGEGGLHIPGHRSAEAGKAAPARLQCDALPTPEGHQRPIP